MEIINKNMPPPPTNKQVDTITSKKIKSESKLIPFNLFIPLMVQFNYVNFKNFTTD